MHETTKESDMGISKATGVEELIRPLGLTAADVVSRRRCSSSRW